MKGKVLIVEDQFIEANNLQMILERAGYEVSGIARSVSEAQKIVDKIIPDLVLLDISLKGPLTGIDLARNLRERGIAFVYLSANSNRSTFEAAKATRPYGFLVKPFREKDVLIMLEIADHLHHHGLESVLKKKAGSTSISPNKASGLHGIVGRSVKLQRVLEHLQIVAPTDTSVLILGESGTGKERIAECVHELSGRSGGPMVKVNCAALPSTLVESILFGHEKGSFTGANERRIGKFEQASGGTIFLDEVGELSIEMQVKLLRVLQEREIERVGGQSTIHVDVRVVAATNRNLEQDVSEGRFRMDLYYRLNVFPLMIPPLRERKDDIPALAEYFVRQMESKISKKFDPIPDEVIIKLTKHDWPGNIRELSHVIERSVLMTKGFRITDISIPDVRKNDLSKRAMDTLEQAERNHIIRALQQCRGKIFGPGGAAEMLGVNASTLNSKIRKLGIEREIDFRSNL